MKKHLLSALALCAIASSALALPKAFYIKSGDSYARYNFGVAQDLQFSDNGTRLRVNGYNETIDLTAIDYISFSPIVDANALTPAAQKERLVKIGDDFYRKFNVNDHSKLIRMVDCFQQVYSDYDFPEEYYPADKYNSPVNRFLKAVGKMAAGSPGAVRAAKNAIHDHYMASDFHGIYKANTQTGSWEKISDAEHVEFRFDGRDGHEYVAKYTASDNYTDWSRDDIAVRIPEKMDVTLSENKETLLTATVYAAINTETNACNLDMQVRAGSYLVENQFAARNTRVTDRVKVTVKGERLLDATSTLHGNNLIDIDGWQNSIDNSTEDDEYYDEELNEWITVEGTRSDSIMSHFSYAVANADIMGQLQLKGKVSSLAKLVDVMDEDSYLYEREGVWDRDKNTHTFTETDLEVVERQINHMCNYSDIAFFYDGKPGIQGYLGWDLDEYSDSWYQDGYWDDETDEWVEYGHTVIAKGYEAMPLIYFPDGTSFAIEDFFNESDFGRLVDDYNEIIDTYYNITGRDRDDD